MFTFCIWCTVLYGDSLQPRFRVALLFPPGSTTQPFSASDVFWPRVSGHYESLYFQQQLQGCLGF